MATIRAALVKGRSSGEEVYAAAEEATKDLKERISLLHHSQKQTAGGTGISPARVDYVPWPFGLLRNNSVSLYHATNGYVPYSRIHVHANVLK